MVIIFFDAISCLRKRFKFGKWTDLMQYATENGGRALKQSQNFDFTISMVRYLEERARTIHLPRGRRKEPEALATPEGITAMRGFCGKLNWTAREGMPNGSGDASLLSSTLPRPKVKGLIEAIAALRRLKEANATITIKSLCATLV